MKKAIRIFICSLDIGGTERHLAQVLPELVKKGWRVRIGVLTHRGALADEIQAQGVMVESLLSTFELQLIMKLPRLIGRMVRLILCLTKLIYQFTQDKTTILHFFLPESYIIGMVAAKLSRFPGPKLMSRRSMNNYQQKCHGIAWIESKLHPMNSIVSGNSLAVIQQLKQELIPENRLRLIYNGIDLAAYQVKYDSNVVRHELNISERALVLIIIANIIPYKGHLDLLQGLSNIKHQLPDDWHLLCIGHDSGIVPELKQFCEKNHMLKQVKWLGSRKDIPRLLSCADIGVLSSHEEGFSNAILEYMAMNLPVVATDVGGNAEAVLDGKTGIVVPAKNPAALGNAILELAQDKDKSIKFGQLGKKRVIEQFSLERCVNAYDKLYQSLIAGKLPPLSEDFTIPCVD